MTDTLYKALNTDGTSPFQGYPWPLPQKNGDGWEPGEWVDAGDGDLDECEHGIHVCTLEQLPCWINEALYICEPAPGTDRLDGDDKTVIRRGRLLRRVETWNKTTERLFAADCAERILPIYETRHPDDDRPHRAIQAARDYAHGRIGEDELSDARAAAWDASRYDALDASLAAARDAGWNVARAAYRDAAWTASLAASLAATRAATAAWDVAVAAALDASLDDARAAGWDVERDWQVRRLGLYLERGVEAEEVPVEKLRLDATKGG